MLRILNVKLSLEYSPRDLIDIASQKLSVDKKYIKKVSLYKKSIDARKKQDIHFVCSLDVEFNKNFKNYKKFISKNVIEIFPKEYKIKKYPKPNFRPLVVGFGPAGMFASLILAEAGLSPIIIERGKDIDTRTVDVNKFWNEAILNTESNVQFGEGGAGTFSDGKLNTGINDFRIRKVLKEFVNCGAPEEIMYISKPHIGTDKLKSVVKNFRKKVINLGAEIRFETKLEKINLKNGKIISALVKHNDEVYEINTDSIVLAVGHSARDTFEMLHNEGIKINQKPFSVGVRIEHLQETINKTQYGKFYNNKILGAADYKLSVHLKNKRGVYTFCMCPGGEVIAASSEKNMLTTNGMSEYKRDKINANSALLVGVTPNDFNSGHPLAGIAFQRKLEEKTFELGGNNYKAPVQLLGDFLKNICSRSLGNVLPSYKPGYNLCNISECLPNFVTESLREGILEINNKLDGFSCYDSILTSTETRSSSPVRIVRTTSFESISVKGLYPCGEGSGYAGGIMSAAVDGIKSAENLIDKYLGFTFYQNSIL